MLSTLLLRVFKTLCYAALALVIAAFGSLFLVSVLDVCPTLHEGGISCGSPGWQQLAEFGMTVVLLTVFTGIPGLLAIGGVIFLGRAIFRRVHKEKSAEDPEHAQTPAPEPSRKANPIKTTMLKVLGGMLLVLFLAGVAEGLYKAFTDN